MLGSSISDSHHVRDRRALQSSWPQSPKAVGCLSYHQPSRCRQDSSGQGGNRGRGAHLSARPAEAHGEQLWRISRPANQERQERISHCHLQVSTANRIAGQLPICARFT